MEKLMVLENVFINNETSKNENHLILDRSGVGREFSTIVQSLDNIKSHYDFKYKSNNWLKLHQKNMRRRPFHRCEVVIGIDESYLINWSNH